MERRDILSLIGFAILSGLFIAGGLTTIKSDPVPPSPSGETNDADPVKTFGRWNQALAEDRVYLHLDRPFYRPGETIWFSAYVRDGGTFRPSHHSDIVHVEIIDPKGTVETTLHLVVRKGQARGDYTLNADAPGGLYRLKAYTNWQKNDADPAFFIKEIQVQDVVLPRLKMKLEFAKKAYGPGDRVAADLDIRTNENKPLAAPYKAVVRLNGKTIDTFDGVLGKDGETRIAFSLPKDLASADGLLNVSLEYEGQTESIARAIPIVLNKIRLTFYPEGGDLTAGLESRVAFQSVNEFGKPADIDGIIEDETGTKAAEFQSFHHGMGVFTWTPQPGRDYTARVTRPEGVLETFALPTAREEGLVMSVVAKTKDAIGLRVASTRKGSGRLFAHVRGRKIYDSEITIKKGETFVSIPIKDAPIGVMAITLFDEDRVARAERLVFVNKDARLTVSIHPDKPRYLPREKVKITVNVRDEKGRRAPGVFSLAVADDQWLTFADDKSSTLLSHMLLEADVRGKIEEPRFYFDPKEPKADAALDSLLMTRGWRRFTWEKLSGTDAPPAVQYPGEKAELGGIVINAQTGQPVPRARVELPAANVVVFTDIQGAFSVRGIDLSEPRLLNVRKGKLSSSTTVHQYTSALRLYLVAEPVRIHDFARVPAAMEGLFRLQDRNVQGRGRVVEEFAPRREIAWEPGAPQLEAVQNRKNRMKYDNPAMGPDQKFQGVVVDRWADAGRGDELLEEGLAGKMVPRAELQEMDMALKNVGGKEFNRPPAVAYYRAREFAAPDYANAQTPGERTDFRKTLYWKGNLAVGRTGSASVEFYNGDAVSSFRATAEGFSNEGGVGAGEALYYTQLPFSLSVKVPPVFVTGDQPTLALTLKNTTDKELTGTLIVKIPEGMKAAGTIPRTVTVPARGARVTRIPLIVETPSEKSEFAASFETLGRTDAFAQPVKIVPQGFPVNMSFSGNEKDQTFRGTLSGVIPHSIQVRFSAYPTVVSDILSGVEGMLREPYGCFEQTSVSSYPNALILSYLKTTGDADPLLVARAKELLEKGYNRLITFSTKDNGYEWFGSDPGHEALTAYGLMQFEDMAKLSNVVDREKMKRTAAWLMSRRDGKGGFLRNPRALDSYGGADQDITNAYIVYALAEAGQQDVEKELNALAAQALRTKDPYLLALAANALFRLNHDARGRTAVDALLAAQSSDGSWTGARHSITRSQGKSLQVETTALACMAILSSPAPRVEALQRGIQFLLSSRSGYGDFGTTQSTILALKALVRNAQWSKRAASSGKIIVSVNGVDVAQRSFQADDQEVLSIDGLEKHLSEGPFSLRVRFVDTKMALPYSLGISYTTRLPASSTECPVALETALENSSVKTGDTARLTAVLTNKTNNGLPMTMAVLGLPAGFTAQPWQLKELQEKREVDFYEIAGSEVVFYYRQMKPGETRAIRLDLKAELAGTFTAPASRTYLYYTNEHKTWAGTGAVTIAVE